MIKNSFRNSIGIKMIFVRPERFMTGTMLTVKNRDWFEWADETPKAVDLDVPFYLGKYPVTNRQYRIFMEDTGHPEPKGMLLGEKMCCDFRPLRSSDWNHDDQPVVCVTRNDMIAFCEWLSRREDKKYRLPSSDEWEFVCRAGTPTDYNWGNSHISKSKANYNWRMSEEKKTIDFRGRTTPVGSYPPNRWGFCDMHGNVNEATDQIDPSGHFTTVRGGSWIDTARRCRSASKRNRWNHANGLASIGFRVACELKPEKTIQVELLSPITVKTEQEDIRPENEDYIADLLWRSAEILVLKSGKIIYDDRCSTDGGKSWQACARILSWKSGSSVQLKDGAILALGKTSRLGNGDSGKIKTACSSDDWQTVQFRDADINVPGTMGSFDDCGIYHNGIGCASQTVLELPDGSLLATMYGRAKNNVGILSDYQRYPMEYQTWKDAVWLIRSTDKGQTWQYYSRLPNIIRGTRGGHCEPGMVLLANNELLLACRTGEHSFPNEQLHFSRSKDYGKTWSRPVPMMVDERPFLGIFPQFCLLRNGILAIVWGRTGYFGGSGIAFSLDGNGTEWSGATPLPFQTGMNDVAELEPDILVVSGANKINEQWELRLLKIKVSKI